MTQTAKCISDTLTLTPTSTGRPVTGAVIVDVDSRAVVVQVADVYDNDADKDLQRDARDQQSEYEVVEAVTLATDVKQKFELGDLRQTEDCDECSLRLRLRLFQLTVTRQQLSRTAA